MSRPNYDEIMTLVRTIGAQVSAPYLGTNQASLLIYGKVGMVKKMLACLGLGLDHDRKVRIQDVRDETGRRWGEIVYADDGRASVMLWYYLV